VFVLLQLAATASIAEGGTFQASFDCAKAATPIETLICSDETLATLDRELGVLFASARSAIDGEGERLAQLKEQRTWLKSRLTTCEIPASGKLTGDTTVMRTCLIGEIRKRNAVLAESLKTKVPEIHAEATPFDSATSTSTGELKIVRITPKGDDVEKREQIVIQFNRPVVPIGRMERNAAEIPVEITPAADCQWRWLNRSALACNLDEEDYLAFSNRYTVKVKTGITDENGATLAATVEHTFLTARPRILSSELAARDSELGGWDAPGIPVINVRFNQQVTQDSVRDSLFIEVDGKRYPLDVRPTRYPRQDEMLMVSLDKRGFWINTQRSIQDEPVAAVDHSGEARLNWIVRPLKALPEGVEYRLVVMPGLVSAFGPELGIEDRIVATGWTLPAFAFLGFSCTDNSGGEIFIPAGSETGKCSAFESVKLEFSVPVRGAELEYDTLVSPTLSYRNNPSLNPLDVLNYNGYRRWDTINHTKGARYSIELPDALRNSTRYTVNLRGDAGGDQEKQQCIEDVFGRCLPADISASFVMDRYRPTFHWSGETAVLEKQIDSDVSLYTANVDRAFLDGEIVGAGGERRQFTHEIPLIPQLDSFERSTFGMKQILDGGSGIVSGTIRVEPATARILGEKDFSAQVTPYNVHAKIGQYSSLVWVTDLATGKPVKGADAAIWQGRLFAKDQSVNRELAVARTNVDGLTLLPGIQNMGGSGSESGYFLFVRKGEDLAYLPLETYDFYRYRSGEHSSSETISAWGTSAEGVYKPGSTVDFKIFVRNMRTEGVEMPKQKTFTLEIHDPKGAVVDTREIGLSEFGTYTGSFKTGKTGAAGRYEVYLRSKKPYLFLNAMNFLVTDYVPASFKVETTLNKQTYELGEEVAVSTAATLHSGGPYTDAKNRYTATVYGQPFSSAYPATADFWFGSPWCIPFDGCGKVVFFDEETQLDREGKASWSFVADGERIGFGDLEVESAVADDRGKNVANMAKARYFGVDRFVGLKTEGFVLTAGKPAKFHFVVTDSDGKPVDGVEVAISSSGRRYTAFRARGAGGTYKLRENIEETQQDEGELTLVSGKTAGEFEMAFDSVGEHSLTASITDSKGRDHSTKLEFWVTGPDAIAWGGDDEDALDFVAEKTSYNVGETARILVKNPYPKARALVTVERMGIVRSWVETFDSSLPEISFEVTEDMVPNFALSVVLCSPRIETRQVDDTYDAGRPEWRMGYIQMEAAGKRHSFDFAISTDAATYRPGQKVHASVAVTARDGVDNGPKELAVAVLDEAVFDLIKGGLDYFDPQKGFYGTLIDSVANYNILRKLVTHAPEKKGDDPGGDGGMSDRMRQDMKSLAYWNPAIVTDNSGRAEVTFNAPDNLTGWRILVLATDKRAHLGVGHTNFKVNRLTEIQPAMPNQVVEGDSFAAAFTVMNRHPETRKITARIAAEGTIAEAVEPATEEIEVGPFQRKLVKMKLMAGKVPAERDIETGRIVFAVSAGDAVDTDVVRHELVVHKKENLDVGANYGTTSSSLVEEPLLFPEQIRPDAGDISVKLSPTLIGNLEGAFRYMKTYPYDCWEQKLSRAVMAAQYQALKKYLSADLVWDGSNGAIAEALEAAGDFQASNGGMGYFKPENDRVDPYLSAFTALGFTMLAEMGYRTPPAVEEKLLKYLQEMLRTDVMPTFYTKGMASSVRAVALAALARSGKMDEDMLTRHLEHLDEMDMFGKSQMLEAAIRLGGQDDVVESISDSLLGGASETGGRIVFNETLDDGYNRILSSTPRTNCAVLSSLLLLADSKKGAEKLQDIPYRLARTIQTMRGQRDHFENTQENLFCMNGLVDFAKRYEKAKPQMEVAVSLEGTELGKTRFGSFQDKPLSVSRPIDATDPGKRKVVRIEKQGDGRIYYATIMRYAPLSDQEKRVNAGIQIDREYYVEDKNDGSWSWLGREDRIKRGDVVRVDLYLRLPAARTQVVVDDPVPGGLEPVNTELATASQVDAAKAESQYAGGSLWMQFADWREYSYSFWSFNHRELLHDAVRFYAEYLPPGNYHLAYTAQAVAEGDFVTQPVFAGEMYDADVYGKGVTGMLHVDP
jgi:hypothetical protein